MPEECHCNIPLPLKEDQSNCVFCKMLAGQSPVSMIHEDAKVAVFVPLSFVNPGHVLIIPRIHAPYISDLDDDTAMHIMKIAHRISAAIRKSSFRCEGINFFLADGEAAMQEVFHYHLHVFPRYAGDGFGLKYDPRHSFVNLPRPELDSIAHEIKTHL